MRVLGRIGVLLTFCGQLTAATINVTDVPSLRTAIQNENAGSGGDTIVLAAGTYTITSPIGTTDASIALEFLKPMTLKSAGGASTVTINCNGVSNGIEILASGVVIDGITLTNLGLGVGVGDYMSPGTVISGIVLRNLVINTLSTSPPATHGIAMNLVNNSVIELCTVTYAYNLGITLSSSNQNLIVNNTISQTSIGQGIALTDSDHNTITGNTIGGPSNIAADAIVLQGAQYNYVGFNTIMNPFNGVTLTLDPGNQRQSIRNWVGNNHIVLRGAVGSDGLWFNDNSNYNMAFGNDATGAQENGFALYNSLGNYLQANVFFANPQGGIYVNGDPSGFSACAPNCIAANFNSVQQNYLYNHGGNGGVTTNLSTNDDVGFNFIAGNPALMASPIAGLEIKGSTGEKLYSNVIQNLAEGEYIAAVNSVTTSGSLYLNRHFNIPAHYSLSPMQWDSGSTVLGGNYYSEFTTANGNPSNGSTPYVKIFDNNSGGVGLYQDRYPYQAEQLGQEYGVVTQLPAAGASLAAGTFKTISCEIQEMVLAIRN